MDKNDEFIGIKEHAKAFYNAAAFSDYVFGMPTCMEQSGCRAK